MLCKPRYRPVIPFDVASNIDKSLGLPHTLSAPYSAPVLAAPGSPVKDIVTPDVEDKCINAEPNPDNKVNA